MMINKRGNSEQKHDPSIINEIPYLRVSNMMTTSTPTVLLFSYGTLQDKSVQIANFGRELTGREDALPGYARRMVAIVDPKVVALSGESHHANAEPSSNPEDAVSGTVFEITEQELAAADKYEEAAEYRRISVTLRSGDQAWVYVRA
jgi:gamma-glutamylcyclotransferase (GGCT)/AIG2-like uncharacterized protein YtfP